MYEIKEHSQFLLVFLLHFVSLLLTTAQPPKAVLYESVGGKGDFFVSNAKYFHDLSEVNFAKRAETACITGTWLFYGAKNFDNFTDGVSYRFRKDGSCFNFEKISRQVSSMRFAGSPTDYRHDCLNLYTGVLFTGNGIRTNSDIPKLNMSVSSFIISGNSKWTLYESENYRGTARCVSPPGGYSPAFFKSHYDYEGHINSVRKGCPNRLPVMMQSTEIPVVFPG